MSDENELSSGGLRSRSSSKSGSQHENDLGRVRSGLDLTGAFISDPANISDPAIELPKQTARDVCHFSIGTTSA